MNMETWLAFVLTFTVISLVPGPSVLMVTGQALARGSRAAFVCILGELVGGVVLVALSLFGVGAILAASSSLFQVVKWAGVAYMAYLGFSQIREARAIDETSFKKASVVNDKASFNAGFFTAILNPKAIVFYVAFLSQFLNPNGNIYLQFLVVMASSTLIVATVLGGYALLASHARQMFRSPLAQRRFGYAGGGCLLGGSAFTAATR